jgi:HlyD family secretion protein
LTDTDTDTTTRPGRIEPSANGNLMDRVQALRLDGVSTDVSKLSGGGSWLPWILSFFLAISWVFIGVKAYKDGGVTRKVAAVPVEATGSSAKPDSTSAGTAPAAGPKVAPGAVVLAQKGVLIPFQQISVSPIDVGGRCVELAVVEGKFFKKGDILAKIEDNSYRAQVVEAEASVAAAVRRLESMKQKLAEMDPRSVRKVEVEQAQAQLDEAIASQNRAKLEFERLNSVTKDSLSIRELQQAEADMRTSSARVGQLKAALTILVEGPRIEKLKGAEADIAASEADVRVAEARLTQSKWRLENCTIKAPIDGTIIKKIAELGNLVNPMAFSGGGGICDIANLADMEVDMDIPERDIEKVYVGQRARVVPDAFKNREYEGVVDRIMPIADDSKSIIKIRVKVKLPPGETPGRYIKPKMSVVCSLIAGEEKK